MKVKELKEWIADVPDDYDVVVPSMTLEKIANCVSFGEYYNGRFIWRNSKSYQKTNSVFIH